MSVCLTCPDCRGELKLDPCSCCRCGRLFEVLDGAPVLLPRWLMDDTESRQQLLYNHVAHEYDGVFKPHVAEHYIRKRIDLVVNTIPRSSRVLDVGCGTGRLAKTIAMTGHDVFGLDLSPAMVGEARRRGLPKLLCRGHYFVAIHGQ